MFEVIAVYKCCSDFIADGIVCTTYSILYLTMYIYADPGQCDQGAVRLSDGVIDQEGRVEVCHDNVCGSTAMMGGTAPMYILSAPNWDMTSLVRNLIV